MYILGLNAYHADASAAIFKDGVLIAAIEEERFRRRKHWAGFPSMSIEFCLREAGISLKEVDYIAIGRDPNAKLIKKIAYLFKNPGGGWNAVWQRFNNARKIVSLEEEFLKIEKISKSFIKQKIKRIEHHRSHLASAFFASPFETAALLSIDGSGDFTTTMIGVGSGNKIEVLQSVDFPHSAGIFYTAFTQLLGFPHYGDEYKIMGLAPYGEPKYSRQLKEVLKFTNDGLFKLNLKYFRSPKSGIISYDDDHIPTVAPLYSDLMIREFGKPRFKDEPLSQYHKNMAASVQFVTEELIFHILKHLHTKTGLKNVCIAGGVAQNSVANGKITRNTKFTEVYIPSAGHDAGISMGSALWTFNQILKQPRSKPLSSAYTGCKYSNEEIEAYLHSRNIKFLKCNDDVLFEKVTHTLINVGVVGWFQGRSEFGPRALGARSILADPRRNDAKELLNAKIKRRESFRPFAPSVLKEYVNEYFEVNDVAPFMEKVFPIRKEKRSAIPAVTHIDGTGRLQTVDKETNPRYYNLINEFRKKTGIPILLNTSFNENEPIVNSPADALDCFLRTQMDMLVLENIIIER
ncbi:MAG TPA: carbamoyltransferase C-terminal domain-containing protein [Chitinophagaceae bacterium]|nr:carbamoyltransferase C-terminal domain-containing protein [Chitinophagaceae bacterium]